jgi:hypothetical protein
MSKLSMELKRRAEKKIEMSRKWRNDNQDIVEIEVSTIGLIEREHLKGYTEKGCFPFHERHGALNIPMVVRPIGDGKYSLVMGFKAYVISKVLNIKTTKVIITEKTKLEIIEELEKNEISEDK